jgi:hypothetical protein
MGVRLPSVASSTFVGPFPATNAETAILTTPPLNITQDFSQILLLASCNILAGASVTALVFRIRRGVGVGGTVVNANPWTVTLAAAASGGLAEFYFDTPGAVAGQQYTLTCSQTGATGASTFNDGALLAFAL